MKKKVYVKKYWAETSTWFFLHFEDGEAIRQVEIGPVSKVLLSLSNPIKGDSMLYDQPLDELDLEESDFIKEEEFMKIWNE